MAGALRGRVVADSRDVTRAAAKPADLCAPDIERTSGLVVRPVEPRALRDKRHVTHGDSDFCQTEIWLRLSLVKGSRFQSLHRSCNVIPARRAMRSNSDGHA